MMRMTKAMTTMTKTMSKMTLMRMAYVQLVITCKDLHHWRCTISQKYNVLYNQQTNASPIQHVVASIESIVWIDLYAAASTVLGPLSILIGSEISAFNNCLCFVRNHCTWLKTLKWIQPHKESMHHCLFKSTVYFFTFHLLLPVAEVVVA